MVVFSFAEFSFSMTSLPNDITFFERGWLSSNNVLIQDAEQAILVDTGYWTHAEQTHALIRSTLGQKPLTKLLNTHLHSDHCGGNAHLQAEFPKIETYIPPGHACFVDQWDADSLTFTPTGQHCPQFTRSHLLHDGDSFVVAGKTWRIHAAPGHDPHSVVIFNEVDRILISADALWENGFGVVFPEIEGVAAFDEVAATLKVISGLNPLLVLPGHGSAFSDVTGALTRANSRLAQFRCAPDKHAGYAAKVLLKFKLLEVQTTSLEEFLVWAKSANYLNLLFTKYSEAQSFEAWFYGLCKSLEMSKACKIEGEEIHNMN
jgi:glyoxylase-like metal-dependent hydrolase (beta-lactamase superfamily II)